MKQKQLEFFFYYILHTLLFYIRKTSSQLGLHLSQTLNNFKRLGFLLGFGY
jgi:hypothetical protein